MSTTLPDIDAGRTITFEEMPHSPGLVFLTVRLAEDERYPMPVTSTYEPTCVTIDRAELVLALCREFDLISQFALFLDTEDRLKELDRVDRNADHSHD